MIRHPIAAAPLALAAILAAAAPAAAQDPAPAPAPSGGAAAAPAPEVDTDVKVEGNRFRVKLRTGAVIEAVLPQGVVWEKINRYGDYVVAKEADRGAGIRLHFVLNLDGELFIKRSDIAEDENGRPLIRDLGELTPEQKAAIIQRVIAQRQKVLEERERALREELARLKAEQEKREGGSGEEGVEPGPGEKPPVPASRQDEEARRGDELLAKYPPPEWNEERLREILRREIVQHIYRTEEERVFIENFRIWKAALERKEKEEAEKGGQ